MAERISDQPFENNLTVSDCEFGRAIEEQVLGETTIQIYNVRSSRIGIPIRVEKKKGETVFVDFLLTTLEVQSDSASEETVNPKKDSIELPPKEQELLESTTNANLESSAKTQRSQEQSLPQVPESKTGTQKEGFTSTLHSVQTSAKSLPELDLSALQKKVTECLAEKSTETALTVALSENSTLQISFEARTEVRHDVSEHQPEVYYSKIEDERCSFEIRDKQSALVVQDQKRLAQSGSHSHSKHTDEILVRKIQSEDYGSDSQNQKYPSGTSTGMQLRDSASEYSFPEALAEKQSEDFCQDAPSREASDAHTYGRTFDVSADEQHFRDTYAEEVSDIQIQGGLSDAAEKLHPDTKAEESSDIQIEILPHIPAEQVSDARTEGRPPVAAEEYFPDAQTEEALDIQSGKSLPDSPGDEVSGTQAEEVSGSHLESVPDTLDEVSDTQAEEASGSQRETLPDTTDVPDTQAELASGSQLESVSDTLGKEASDTQAEEASGSQLETLPATTDDIPDTQAEEASGSQLETLPATTDDIPDTQAEEASGSQLETLPATTDDIPDTQAEEASGSQLETLPATTDDIPDTRAEEASGSQLETLPATTDDIPDTQAEEASGSQLETLPATTDDIPDTQAEEASGSQLETLPATTDDIPDTQAEEASGSQLETLPATTDDIPDTQAEEASGSQLETLPATTDDIPDTQAEEASGSQLETLPATTDDIPDTQAEEASGSQLETLPATTDDIPDTQAEEASGSQLETLPATTYDIPDTRAEEASGSQLETLPATTDDIPDTRAEFASGSQLETLLATTDDIPDTQAELASGSQLETLPATTDIPDTQAEEASDLKTEELVAQGQSEMVSNFPGEQHSLQVSALVSHSEGTRRECLQDTTHEMITTDVSESSILTPEIPQIRAESSVDNEIAGMQTDSVETQNQRYRVQTTGNESPPELTPYVSNVQACFIQAHTQELTSEVQSEMPEVPTVEGTQEAHTESSPTKTETQDSPEVSIEGAEAKLVVSPAEEHTPEVLATAALETCTEGHAESSPTKTETQDSPEVSIEGAEAKLVVSPAEEHTPEVLATAALETCTEGHAEGQLQEGPSGTQDYGSPVQYASKTDVAGDSETGKACQEDLNAGELYPDTSPHSVSSVEGKSPDESIPSSPKSAYPGAGCISQEAVSSDRAAVSTTLTFQYGSQGSISPGATSSEVLNIEHPEPITDDHAYVMGDKIDELFPFVYAVSTPLIDFRCSYCFTLLTNKRKCNLCPHAFYCNRSCQDKDLRIHKRECIYLRKLRRSEVPARMVRLLARAVLKKEDPLGKRTFYKVGDKPYHFQDLPPNTDVVSSSKFEFTVRNAYHHFRKFLHDRLISYEEFCILYGKVNRHMTYVLEAPGIDVGTAMYFGLVDIEHSCRPNANMTFIGNKAQIIACKAIEAADPTVTLSLVPLRGKTEGRTSVLMLKGREPCKCHLCKSRETDAKFYEVIGRDSPDDKIKEAEQILCSLDETMEELGPDLKNNVLEAISTLDGVTGNLHSVRTSLIEAATDFSESDKNYRNAIVYGEELLRIYRYLFGDVHPVIVNRLLNLSVSYILARDALKAREYYSEALQVACNTYGPEHPFFKRIRYRFIQQEESRWENAHVELQYYPSATYLYRV